MAAVVKVQHLRAQIPAGGTTVTLNVGPDYDAPGSLSSAYVDVKAHFNPSAGDSGVYVENIVTHRNPKDLLTSITLTKTVSQPGITYIALDIVEYVGAPGGPYEFIVRDQAYLSDATFGTTPTLTGPALSGVVDTSDVMLLISSSGAGFSGALQIQNAVLKTAELVGLVPTFTSGVVVYTDGPHGLSYQAIEWVGSAYTVHRVESTLNCPNTHPLGFTLANLAKTFSHFQYTVEGDWNNFNSDSVLWMHQLGATSFASTKSGVANPYPNPKHVAWIVEVDDTGASQPFSVTRYSPTGLTSASPNDGFSITAVRDRAQSGIGAYSHLWSKNDGRPFGVGGSSDAYLASDTLIAQRMPELAVPYDAHVEVIEWPEVTAGSTPQDLNLNHFTVTTTAHAVEARPGAVSVALAHFSVGVTEHAITVSAGIPPAQDVDLASITVPVTAQQLELGPEVNLMLATVGTTAEALEVTPGSVDVDLAHFTVGTAAHPILTAPLGNNVLLGHIPVGTTAHAVDPELADIFVSHITLTTDAHAVTLIPGEGAVALNALSVPVTARGVSLDAGVITVRLGHVDVPVDAHAVSGVYDQTLDLPHLPVTVTAQRVATAMIVIRTKHHWGTIAVPSKTSAITGVKKGTL